MVNVDTNILLCRKTVWFCQMVIWIWHDNIAGVCFSLTTYLCLESVLCNPMGTNYAPLLDDLFFYSYETHFIQWLLKKNEKKLARFFNFTFLWIDDVLSQTNYKFTDYVDSIDPIELELKDATDMLYTLHTIIDSKINSSNTCIWSTYTLYTSRSWYHIPVLVVPLKISLIEEYFLHGSWWTKGSYWLSRSHHFKSFKVSTMTWLTITEYVCRRWQLICSVCRNHNPVHIHDFSPDL